MQIVAAPLSPGNASPQHSRNATRRWCTYRMSEPTPRLLAALLPCPHESLCSSAAIGCPPTAPVRTTVPVNEDGRVHLLHAHASTMSTVSTSGVTTRRPTMHGRLCSRSWWTPRRRTRTQSKELLLMGATQDVVPRNASFCLCQLCTKFYFKFSYFKTQKYELLKQTRTKKQPKQKL